MADTRRGEAGVPIGININLDCGAANSPAPLPPSKFCPGDTRILGNLFDGVAINFG